jgi:hypothetical protein
MNNELETLWRSYIATNWGKMSVSYDTILIPTKKEGN